MAYDKVVDSYALDAGLKQIADAIRGKNGTSGGLAFPSAMAAAIEAIETGGGGDTSGEDGIVERTITEYNNDRVETVGGYAFYSCTALTTVNFPAVTTIGDWAFASCTALTTVSFPAATYIGPRAFAYCTTLTTASFPAATFISGYAFYSCSALTTASFPAATTVGSYAFRGCSTLTTVNFPVAESISGSAFASCTALTTVSFPAAKRIVSSAFANCSALTSLYLLGSSLCTLAHSSAFSGAGITSSTGTIYVPASLLASYQAATNWAYFSTRFVAGD